MGVEPGSRCFRGRSRWAAGAMARAQHICTHTCSWMHHSHMHMCMPAQGHTGNIHAIKHTHTHEDMQPVTLKHTLPRTPTQWAHVCAYTSICVYTYVLSLSTCTQHSHMPLYEGTCIHIHTRRHMYIHVRSHKPLGAHTHPTREHTLSHLHTQQLVPASTCIHAHPHAHTNTPTVQRCMLTCTHVHTWMWLHRFPVVSLTLPDHVYRT